MLESSSSLRWQCREKKNQGEFRCHFHEKSRQISKEYRQFFIAVVSVFRSQLTTDQRSKESIPSAPDTDISLVIVFQTVQNNTYLYGICSVSVLSIYMLSIQLIYSVEEDVYKLYAIIELLYVRDMSIFKCWHWKEFLQ